MSVINYADHVAYNTFGSHRKKGGITLCTKVNIWTLSDSNLQLHCQLSTTSKSGLSIFIFKLINSIYIGLFKRSCHHSKCLIAASALNNELLSLALRANWTLKGSKLLQSRVPTSFERGGSWDPQFQQIGGPFCFSRVPGAYYCSFVFLKLRRGDKNQDKVFP